MISKSEFKSVQKNLLLDNRICFKDFNFKKRTPLKKFFETFHATEKKHDTIKIDGTIVCSKGKFARSVQDIFSICKFYYPRLTLEKFLLTVNKTELVGHWCDHINKFCIASKNDYAKSDWGFYNGNSSSKEFLNWSFNDLSNYAEKINKK